MLKVRVIPTLLWKTVGLVKGRKFDSWRRVGPVMPAIKVYNKRQIDELVLVDIVATQAEGTLDLEAVRDFAEECSVPFTVGGGIREIGQIRDLLSSGADKVTINSHAYSDPNIITAASKRYGSQCVVASVDARLTGDGEYSCFSHSGRRDEQVDPAEWAKRLCGLGAGEILITSIDRDGTLEGYDLRLVERVVEAVDIPVIASGGAGNYNHMIDAIQKAGASAVAAASMFHYTEQTPAGAKAALSAAGLPVRSSI